MLMLAYTFVLLSLWAHLPLKYLSQLLSFASALHILSDNIISSTYIFITLQCISLLLQIKFFLHIHLDMLLRLSDKCLYLHEHGHFILSMSTTDVLSLSLKWFFFLFFFFLTTLLAYLLTYLLNLFMAALGLRCCVWAFSSCGEWGLLFVAVRRHLITVASLVVEHGLQARRLQQLWRTGSVVVAHRLQSTGSVVVAHGLSCSVACGIFPDQGSSPHPLHWQVDS